MNLQDLPSNEFKLGHFTKVPLLVDRDGYEGTFSIFYLPMLRPLTLDSRLAGVLFSNRSMTTVEEEMTDLHHLFPYAKDSFVDRLYELYPSDSFNNTFYHRAQWYGDFIIGTSPTLSSRDSTLKEVRCLTDCPSAYMAAAVADAGLPAYKLLFYAGSELHGATSPYLYAVNNNG